jgi:hypothetical protein
MCQKFKVIILYQIVKLITKKNQKLVNQVFFYFEYHRFVVNFNSIDYHRLPATAWVNLLTKERLSCKIDNISDLVIMKNLRH